MQKMRVDGVKQTVPFYTLDVIISVGYRVKSKRGVEFCRWANSVLKQYILKGAPQFIMTATAPFKYRRKSYFQMVKVLSPSRYSTVRPFCWQYRSITESL